MKKNYFIILIVILIILIAGGGIYFFSFRGDIPEGGGEDDRPFLFPFGDGKDTDRGTGDEDQGSGGIGDLDGFVPKFRKISIRPSTEGAFVKQDEGLFVRYVERETGHLFEASTESLNQRRLTNTTIPRIYSATWSSDGESIVLQYLEEEIIQSFAAEIETPEEESAEKKLTGVFLSPDIKQLGFSGDNLFTLTETEDGSIGIISNSKGGSKNQVFSSPLKEWLVEWPNSGTITFTTKPSLGIEGFMYFLNTKSESFRKILGGISNLTTLARPDLSSVLYSSGTSLSVYEVDSGESTLLPTRTLPEKCVWSEIEPSVIYCGVPKSLPKNLPESWYQGLVSFSDNIWKINTETNQTDLLIDSEEEYGVSVDLTKPVLDEEETYLLFVNKKDSTLWVLELKEKSS